MKLNRRSVMAGALGGLMAPALALRAHAHDQMHDVAIRNFAFEPETLVVHPTDKIRFTNHDLAPHTATATDGRWETDELARGDSVTLTVTEDWTGDYFCAFHPAMTATLKIENH